MWDIPSNTRDEGPKKPGQQEVERQPEDETWGEVAGWGDSRRKDLDVRWKVNSGGVSSPDQRRQHHPGTFHKYKR